MRAADYPCPFCGGALVAGYTEAAGGVVYISTRCTLCRERIDAAGIGAAAADRDFGAKCAVRVGTCPDLWRIPERLGGPWAMTRRKTR
jgi:hypothetical protein